MKKKSTMSAAAKARLLENLKRGREAAAAKKNGGVEKDATVPKPDAKGCAACSKQAVKVIAAKGEKKPARKSTTKTTKSKRKKTVARTANRSMKESVTQTIPQSDPIPKLERRGLW